MQTISEKISSIRKQFLCNVSLINFNWHNIFQDLILDADLQATLLNKTVNSQLVLDFPLEINYQKSFLKHLMRNLDRLQSCDVQETVISDDLYSAYGRLVALGSESHNFKHYSLESDDKVISLKESSNLISDGTTGLRTWQAALALSEWLVQNKQSFKDKTVLELGSGVGLAGLVLAKECSPKCAYLTDCHETVLKTLCDNVDMNCKHSTDDVMLTTEESDCFCPMKHRCLHHITQPTEIHALNLPWEEIVEDQCGKLGIVDIVIAADIIYDDELFEPLTIAMRNLANFCGVEEFIFLCTERNPKTLDSFLRYIESASFVTTEMEVPSQKIFLWPTDTSIKLFRFTENK